MWIETIDRDSGLTRLEEMHGKEGINKDNTRDPADGTEVWTQNNKPEERDSGKDNTRANTSPAEFEKSLTVAMAPVQKYEQANPDARAAVETPKSAAKTQETLDKGMNAVYP